MEEQSPDYSYTDGFLKKLNEVDFSGTPIKNSFFIGDYNLWQLYQQMLFEDIKAFSKTKKYVEEKRNFVTWIKDILFSLAVIVESFIAILVLLLSRKEVIVYSVDVVTDRYQNDSRLSTLYKVLTEKKVPYIEIIKTTLSRRLLRNFFSRKRPTIYFEAFYMFYNLFFGSGFVSKAKNIEEKYLTKFATTNEINFAKNLLYTYEKRAYLTAKVIPLLSFIIKKSSLKIIFAIDDYRYYLEVMLAAYFAKVKTVAIQHGHFTKYHVGSIPMYEMVGKAIGPDTLLVWSDYWKGELERLNSFIQPQNVTVGGWNQNQLQSEGSTKESRAVKTILFPYETAAPKRGIKSVIEKIIAGGHYRVMFKLRNDKSREEQLKEYGLEAVKDEHFVTETDSKKALLQSDAMIGVYSTFLYDGILEGIPVGVMLFLSDYGGGMVTNNLADSLKEDDVISGIEKILATSKNILEERKKKLLGEKPLLMYDTVKHLVESAAPNKNHV
jgi:hypothetical protein